MVPSPRDIHSQRSCHALLSQDNPTKSIIEYGDVTPRAHQYDEFMAIDGPISDEGLQYADRPEHEAVRVRLRQQIMAAQQG